VSTQGIDKKDKKCLEQCMLGEEDWEELTNIHALLYQFWELTMHMQGNVVSNVPDEDEGKQWNSVYGHPGERLFGKVRCNEDGALFNVLPVSDILLSKLEVTKIAYQDNPHLATCVNLAWQKLDEYYKKSDDSKVYLVASILDPPVKLRHFEKNWRPSWLVVVKGKLEEYLKEFMISMKTGEPPADDSSDIEMEDSQTSRSTFGSWREGDDDEVTAFRIGSEWDKYLSTARVEDCEGFSVQRWWIDHAYAFPTLSRIALETLAIPRCQQRLSMCSAGRFSTSSQ